MSVTEKPDALAEIEEALKSARKLHGRSYRCVHCERIDAALLLLPRLREVAEWARRADGFVDGRALWMPTGEFIGTKLHDALAALEGGPDGA